MMRFYWFVAAVILALTVIALIGAFVISLGYLLWAGIGAFLFTSLVKVLINNPKSLML